MKTRLYRIILPVSDIEQAQIFYARLLDMSGERISPGRHYFNCGGAILALFDPQKDGDDFVARPNAEHIYFAVDELEAVFARAMTAGCLKLDSKISTMPWGERCFYGVDPFGNPFCVVDEKTIFTGGFDLASENA